MTIQNEYITTIKTSQVGNTSCLYKIDKQSEMMKQVEKLRDEKTSPGDYKEKMDKPIIIKGYFYTLLSETDKSSQQKMIIDTKFSTIKKLDIIFTL